ncbi:MAG TPA: hypothetical protein VK815_03635 [Candidatus Acidoferrales bacterium]|jgi:fibronectin-binding autotransporter adhesin|nr:hypothetical protein [Candidatus Acidoferrales bacterium]
MKKILLQLRSLTTVFAVFAIADLANAQSTWGGGGTDQNWSTPGNWSSGGAPSSDAVIFPAGAFPITTNTQGAVNNIVQSSTAITTLNYNNATPQFYTTLIPSGSTLTVGGNVTFGSSGTAGGNVTIMGAGSLVGSGTSSTFSMNVASGTESVDLSKLTNFVFNPGGAGNTFAVAGSASSSGQLSLAAVSNNITATILNIGNNNNGGTCTMNLGNGTNIINADTINQGIDKTTGNMQFLNNAGGGLKIANHTGTGRANITLGGTSNSGSTGTSDNGNMLFNSGTVNILAGTLTMGSRAARVGGGSANGVLSFTAGIVDVTTINMAVNTSGTGENGTLSVGGGTLKIGTGGMSLANQGGGTAGTGNLIVTNGGTVICSNNIFKTTSRGTATITLNGTINGASLVMQSLAGTIGVANTIPIDNFNLTNATLTLPVAASSANVVVVNFNPDTATTSTININSMPSITIFPSQFPVITYIAAGSGGNLTTGGILPNIALGTLPNTFGNFTGYLSNDVASATIWLVVTNGPLAGAAEWGGGVNNQWDTTSLNWTNNGSAVAYQDGDFVTFDDLGRQSTVNLTGMRKPATLEINNSVLNYTFTGSGSISGPVGLSKDGTATLTLAETGGDNFTLGITNNAGTIILDDTNSAISGGLLIASGATVQIGNNDVNGSLPSGTLDDEGTLVFDRSNNLTVGTAIPGGGTVVQSGSGKLTLSTVNTYTGSTTVGNGALALTGTGSIATSSGVVVSNATLDVSGVTAATATLSSLTLTNSILNVKVGYLQTNLNLTGGLTMQGTANTINVISLPPIANYPATLTLIQTAGGISGYNFVLGTLPAASPANVGTIALSGDGNSVLLTLTAGPIGVRPSVTWSGVDAIGNVNTNWSDAQNWITPGVPAAAESVTFNNNATAIASPFDLSGGVGSGGVVDAANINNIVDVSLTNAALSYANAGNFHNTQIASGKTLTVNGNLTVSGSGGTVTILGTGAAMSVKNSGTLAVEAATTPTLDMSGLATFTANVSQIGVGYDIDSPATKVLGVMYLARTNRITTGVGSFGTGAALVVGGCTGTTASTLGTSGQLYLGQTNALYVDGILVGLGSGIGSSASTGDLMAFNPAFVNSPVAYIRGILGDSSRVTQWSLGDDSVNLNNDPTSFGFVCDFSGGTLNALVNTLIVGQGAHGNEVNGQVIGTFNMGAGRLDVTTLDVGVSGSGVAGAGIGVMSVNDGTVIANSLGLGLGTVANTSGMLSLSNAILVVSNNITVGNGAITNTLLISSSTVKMVNGGTIGSPAASLSILNLDGAILQLNVDGSASSAVITATTVGTNAPSTINIGAVANVSGPVQIPLISYTGTDPYGALSLGTVPAGYNATLVDNVGNSSVDLSIGASVNTAPTNITTAVSGNLLTLSWPADHTGWRLQVQTNTLGAGLGTNWADVAGSTTVNSVNATINPANGTVFYRMVYP